MRAFYRKLGVFFSLCFIGFVAGQAYYLLANFSVLDSWLRDTTLILLLGGLMFSGFLAIIMLFVSQKQNIDVIYIQDNPAGGRLGHNTLDGSTFNGQTSDAYGQTGEFSVRQVERIIIENQYDKKQLLDEFLQNVCRQLEASVGVLYLGRALEGRNYFEVLSTYAYYNPNEHHKQYEIGQGLVGQVAKNGKAIQLDTIPEGYVEVVSGLGKASPKHLMIFPVKNDENEILSILELASFQRLNHQEEVFLQEVALLLAKEIEANEYQSLNL
ncbi:MAG: GAF domain-containing protein [Microscillaceae bacterium]|nr:GAF domain-containing protein [Microscillaceae bacterium]